MRHVLNCIRNLCICKTQSEIVVLHFFFRKRLQTQQKPFFVFFGFFVLNYLRVRGPAAPAHFNICVPQAGTWPYATVTQLKQQWDWCCLLPTHPSGEWLAYSVVTFPSGRHLSSDFLCFSWTHASEAARPAISQMSLSLGLFLMMRAGLCMVGRNIVTKTVLNAGSFPLRPFRRWTSVGFSFLFFCDKSAFYRAGTSLLWTCPHADSTLNSEGHAAL